MAPFYRTSSVVRLCWELEEPQGPQGHPIPTNPPRWLSAASFPSCPCVHHAAVTWRKGGEHVNPGRRRSAKRLLPHRRERGWMITAASAALQLEAIASTGMRGAMDPTVSPMDPTVSPCLTDSRDQHRACSELAWRPAASHLAAHRASWSRRWSHSAFRTEAAAAAAAGCWRAAGKSAARLWSPAVNRGLAQRCETTFPLAAQKRCCTAVATKTPHLLGKHTYIPAPPPPMFSHLPSPGSTLKTNLRSSTRNPRTRSLHQGGAGG